jgi:predicted DNA-binding transcriptional regulator YafY
MKDTGMKTKNALPRIYFIDRKIASGSCPNSRQLAREYEVSVSTISRDIEFMRVMLNAPIKYDAARRGYYYSEKTYRVPGGFATADDMQAIGIVKSLLVQYQNTPVYGTVRQLLENITAPLSGGDMVVPLEDRIAAPPPASAAVDGGVWNAVMEGLRENRVLEFEYRGMWDEKHKKRRVRPWQLLFDSGAWFLYGYAEERGAARLFSLSRMKNAGVTKTPFTLPADYSYLAQTGGSYFGVFAGNEKQKYRVAFYGGAAVWAGERKWAADQTIEETAGGVIIGFTSSQYDKVLEWVLSRGCLAMPLEPEDLVEDWKNHVEEMRRLAEI